MKEGVSEEATRAGRFYGLAIKMNEPRPTAKEEAGKKKKRNFVQLKKRCLITM